MYLTYIIEKKGKLFPFDFISGFRRKQHFREILKFFSAPINETMTDEAIQTHYGRDTVMATVKRMSDGKIIEYKLSDFPVAEKLEKFMEDVK